MLVFVNLCSTVLCPRTVGENVLSGHKIGRRQPCKLDVFECHISVFEYFGALLLKSVTFVREALSLFMYMSRTDCSRTDCSRSVPRGIPGERVQTTHIEGPPVWRLQTWL